MQNLWRLACLALIFGVAGLSRAADQMSIKVATWNLHWFPSGSQIMGTPEEERQRVSEFANVVREAGPDILLVQEVRNPEVVEELARDVGGGLRLLVCSTYTEHFGSALSAQQVAILSKLPVVATSQNRWTTFGAVDPPRGFAFACLRVGATDVAVYCVHLKSNLGSEDLKRNQLNILKREIAVEELFSHLSGVEGKIGRSLEAIVVGGDFNTNFDDERFVSESTLRTLCERGFTARFQSDLPSDRVTLKASGRYPATTFDYVFTRGVEWKSGLRTTASDLSDHCLVVGELWIKQPRDG
jgi:endonuclease/exonuclease/phosphatase family metal-dependent hydrolase